MEVVVRIWVGREKSVFSIPGRVERAPDMSFMQASQVMGTEKVAWYAGRLIFAEELRFRV